MKKFLNQPPAFVDEMIEGLVAAHPDQLALVDNNRRCVIRAARGRPGKVGIATGGGSGHLPLFVGYVGEGLLDGCSVGGVFQSPSAEQMLKVTRAIDQGAGVLYVYGNYGGDVMSFDMAAELAAAENIQVAQVAAGEDVASAPRGQEEKRRGVAGIFYVYKIAGALSEEGATLAEVKRVAQKTCDNVRSMGVALSPCIVPEIGRPGFEIGANEMEIGMGIHGERGIRRGPLLTANEIVDEIVPTILEDLPFVRGDEVSILVNGLGATPREELYVLFRRVRHLIGDRGIKIFKAYVGEFATSMEMAGASITLLRLDDELKRLLARPAQTPFFAQGELL
ncbi:MAG: dihydroxyacetone kinase subunit DhaK [Deltaproteobacteria bacterium]|nr:dihydroxyacetone kinase subunit DhaK [Deltaproteobacteria bacterium]